KSFLTVLGTASARSTSCSALMTSAVTLSLRNPSIKKRLDLLPATWIRRSMTSKERPTPSRPLISSKLSSHLRTMGCCVVGLIDVAPLHGRKATQAHWAWVGKPWRKLLDLAYGRRDKEVDDPYDER